VLPEILICDEITSSLDASVQSNIVNLLQHIQREFGTAIMFISHDINIVSDISNDVLVLNDGSAVEFGPSKSIMTNPKAEYTRALFRDVPTLPDFGFASDLNLPEKEV